MILHTINKSPQNPALKACLRVATKDSAILLIEDGVYAALLGPDLEALLQHKVYALAPDIKARGLLEKLSPQITLVDYSGFVALVEQYDTVQSWY